MKSHQVVRVNLSPYQHQEFTQREKARLERLPGLEYRLPEDLHPEKDIVLITNTHTVLRSLPPDLLRRTKLILHPNSGHDHFNADQKLWEKIPVVVGYEIRAQAVAEYCIGCLFEAMLDLPQHIAWNRERRWDRKLASSLSVLLFGYGHIGKIVARTLDALGSRVTVVDPFVPDCPWPKFKQWRDVNVADFQAVVSCMSLNSTSRKIFNEDFFSVAHDELIFINAARGGLVDEAALKEFLLSHPRAFAFLDVFEQEPFGEDWHHFPQVWKTSHIAGVHRDLDQGILDFEEKVLSDFLTLEENDFMIKYKRELLQFKWRQGELI